MLPSTLRLATILAAAFCTHTAAAQITVRVSVKPGGAEARLDSGYTPAPITSDGRWIAFDSRADNIVLGDTNNTYDVFVFDRVTAATTCVSVTPGGTPGNSSSYFPTMAADGRYVLFASAANNLVAGDFNGETDLFLRDLQSGTTTLVSVDSAGVQGTGDSSVGRLSSNAHFVALTSASTNLVAGDTNGAADTFLRDLTAGTTERVSLSSTGGEGNGPSGDCGITPDGRFVAFDSLASNLVAGDFNGTRDVFVRDRQTGTTVLASVADDGTQSNGTCFGAEISADGRFVCFYSMASTLLPQDTNGAMDVYLRDLQTGFTELVSVGPQGELGDAGSTNAALSADGRYVAFTSLARFFGETIFDADVFLRDRLAQTTTPISVSGAGGKGNGWSTYASLTPDARFVTFKSAANNIVSGDWNFEDDVFVRDLELVSPPIATYCVSKTNSEGCVGSRITSTGVPSLSGESQFFVAASSMIAHKPGTFFWSTGSAGIPFGGGALCVAAPLVRTGIQDSGSVPAVGTCTGAYSFHFSPDYMQQEGVAAGTTLYGQYWARDPGYAPPNNIALTEGLRFTIVP